MRRLVLAVVSCLSVSVPALADDDRDCFQQKDPQRRITSCSGIIQRDPNDATAYHNRAVAYGLAGDVDHAIADYTKTIEIRPDNAAAYENRGRAYASKGDYTHAVADVNRASELVAKAAAQPIVNTYKAPKAVVAAPKAKVVPPVNPSVAKETSDASWPSWASFRDRSMD